MGRPKLSPAEEEAYADLAQAARRLRQLQRGTRRRAKRNRHAKPRSRKGMHHGE
jgi:hypothetical protein